MKRFGKAASIKLFFALIARVDRGIAAATVWVPLALPVVLPTIVHAQVAAAPSVETPVYPIVTDANGVSGVDGSISFSHTIALGSPESGMRYSLVYNSRQAAVNLSENWAMPGWRDSFSGSIACFADRASETSIFGGWWASVDGVVDVVNSGYSERIASDEPIPSGRPLSPGGGAVFPHEAPREHRYRRSDGTDVMYLDTGVYESDDYIELDCGRSDRIEKIIKPSGEVIEYHYDHYGDFNQSNVNNEKRIVISSSLGYQVRISGYPLGSSRNEFGCIRLGPPQHEPKSWTTACISSVTIVDIGVDNCPTYGDCVYSRSWPRIDISYHAGGVTRVTDSIGNYTDYTVAPQEIATHSPLLITRVQSSGGRDRRVAYLSVVGRKPAWLGGQVSSISEGASEWSYIYNYTGPNYIREFVGSIAASDPLGGSVVYNTSYRYLSSAGVSSSYISSIVDAAGGVYKYDWFGYHKYRPKKITYPSGLRIDYSYDLRHNLTNIARYPAGGGAALQVAMGYDVDCLNIFTCNQPKYRIDEMGNRTDFTYDPGSGALLTVVEPAAGSGLYPTVRPQTSYEYEVSAAGITRLIRTRTCSTAQICAGSADERVVETLYDERNRPIKITNRAGDWAPTTLSAADPRSSVTSMTYSALGDVATIDGPLPGASDTTWMYYDAMRRPVVTVSPDPDGSGPLWRKVERFVYDGDGRQIRAEIGTATAIDGSDFVLSNFKRSTYDPLSGLLIKVEEVVQ